MAEVLGSVRLLVNGTAIDLGGPRQRRLLGVLLTECGTVVSTDRLIEAVFEGEPSEAARDTFRTYVARLRRALTTAGADASAVILTAPPGYLIDSSAVTRDSALFEEGVRDAQDRLALGDADGAVLSVEAALALWRGPAYSEFAAEEWAQPEAIRLEELRLVAREVHAEALIESGRHDTAVPHIEELIAHEPLREGPRRLLMLALYRGGRHAEALRRGRAFTSYLAEETGLEATVELVELERMIIERDPRLDARPQGRKLRGYVLGEPVSESPLGIVYRADQPSIGRDVAITVVPAEQADDPGFVRRFEVHAQQVAAIEHPNVVPLYDYWREPGGAYLVTRYLSGGSLENRLADGSTLAVSDVVAIVSDVGAALTAAHGQGVVHGQLEPASVLFDEAGTAYLTEFGVGSDLRSMPADIEALAGVATTLWDRSSPPPGEQTSSSVVVVAGVEAVLRRGRGADESVDFASVGEFVEAFRTAVGSDDGDRGLPGSELLATPTIEGPNPYRGLYAFDETDADVFFGRDALIDDLVSELARDPFLAVVGPSGSGKSSAVRAGLLPRLRAAGAFVATMVPGTRPIAELEMALTRVAARAVPDLAEVLPNDVGGLARILSQILPDGAGPIVLVIDQFEEAFTISDTAERDLLLASLRHAVDEGHNRLRVVVSARADLLGRILDHRVIGDRVRDRSRLVTPLSANELHEAVVGPAERAGVAVEPALATALVADAIGAAGSLPLLQYALTELYEHRVDGTMTLGTYERLGGLTAVLTQRAEEIYNSLSTEDQESSRRLFSRLVAPGEGAEDTRRRSRRSELATVPTRVLDRFGAARLISFDRDPLTREPTIEVAHEALIREWPRLRSWVESDRQGLRTLGAITAASAEWEAADRDPGMLYRGTRLAIAQEWESEHHREDLSPRERAFLDTSREARDAEAERERRHVRRLRLLATSVAVVALIAVVVGVIAVRQRQVAEDNAAEAERRALENRTAQLTSEARLAIESADPDLAILLALAAYDTSTEISDTPQPGVVAALHQTVQASRLERIIPAGRTQIALSPNGRHVAMDGLGSLRRLLVYDLESGEVVVERRLDHPNGGLAYSPDGSLLAVALADRTSGSSTESRSADLPAMLLLDSATLETVQRLDGGLSTWLPSWSADGRNVLAVGVFGETRMWSVDRPEIERLVAGPAADMVAFVPGTNTIGILADGTLDIVDRDTGEALQSIEAPDSVGWMELSPGGGTVAFVDLPGGRVHVVELGSDETRMIIEHPSPRDVRFSPDGTLLSISGNTDAVRVVELDTGEAIELRGHGTGSAEHAYSHSGDELLAATLDGSTRVWNLSAAGPDSLGNLAIGGRPVGGVRVVGESSLLVQVATGSNETQIVRFDTATGASDRIADFWFASFQWPVFSADGSLVAGFSPTDLVAHVVDVESGATSLDLRPCETPQALDARNRWVLVDVACVDLAQDPDESGARRGFVDLDTGELISPIDEPGLVYGAELGPPSTIADDLLVYITNRNRVAFLDASTREVTTVWNVPGVPILDLRFSRDGSRLGMSAQSRQGILFDVEAILAGASARDALTIFEEMSTGPTQSLVPVGDYIVTTHDGAQVRQWDPGSGDLLVDATTDSGRFAIAFAMPDDSTVMYTDAGGVFRRFRTDVDDLVELARSRVQRGFTRTECERFFPDGDCPAELID